MNDIQSGGPGEAFGPRYRGRMRVQLVGPSLLPVKEHGKGTIIGSSVLETFHSRVP